MPALDKPLNELYQYQGTNPRPEDFDDYWARAMKELDATDPKPELVPSKAIFPRNAEIFDLFFTGVGGARIYAKYLRPKKTEKPHPAILQFHGYAGNSSEWIEKLSYVGQGMAVASMDCRGQGGQSEDNSQVKGPTLRGHFIRGLGDHPDRLLFRQIFLDTVQLARVVAGFEEVDGERLGSLGGSQGGALSIACAALAPQIKRCVSLYPFLSDYKRVWNMDLLAVSAYEELRIYMRQFDPLHEREDEIFRTLGYIDVQNLASRIQAEVLMGLTLMDNVCPPSTQFAVFNKIRSPKEAVVYQDYAHEGLPGFSDKSYNFLSGLLD